MSSRISFSFFLIFFNIDSNPMVDYVLKVRKLKLQVKRRTGDYFNRYVINYWGSSFQFCCDFVTMHRFTSLHATANVFRYRLGIHGGMRFLSSTNGSPELSKAWEFRQSIWDRESEKTSETSQVAVDPADIHINIEGHGRVSSKSHALTPVTAAKEAGVKGDFIVALVDGEVTRPTSQTFSMSLYAFQTHLSSIKPAIIILNTCYGALMQ